MNPPIRFAVLTVSDRSARGQREDRGGPAVVEFATRLLSGQCVETAIVPDEAPAIAARLRAWVGQDHPPDLVLTTGGTGLSPRDLTPEATASVLERRHDALLELARLRCYAITPLTFLSRGIAGTAGRCLIINLPGSPRGATEMLEALADILPHALLTLRGPVDHDPPPNPLDTKADADAR